MTRAVRFVGTGVDEHFHGPEVLPAYQLAKTSGALSLHHCVSFWFPASDF